MNKDNISKITVFNVVACPYCDGEFTEVLDEEPWEYEHRVCRSCGKDFDLLFEPYCVGVLSHNGDDIWKSECGD